MIKLNDKILEMISGGDNLHSLTPDEKNQLREILRGRWEVVVCKDENGTLYELADGTPIVGLAIRDSFIGNKFGYVDEIPYIVAPEAYVDDVRLYGHVGNRAVVGLLSDPLYHMLFHRG